MNDPTYQELNQHYRKAVEQINELIVERDRLKAQLVEHMDKAAKACGRLESENIHLKAQLDRFHAAMEKEKSGKWREELMELANALEMRFQSDITARAARELRYTADICTHKANFVPMELEIKELKAKLKELQLYESGGSFLVKELKAQLERVNKDWEQAQAACAQMRSAMVTLIEEVDDMADLLCGSEEKEDSTIGRAWKALLKDTKKSLSTDCGKGYVNVSELTATIELLRQIDGRTYKNGDVYREITRLKALQEKTNQ